MKTTIEATIPTTQYGNIRPKIELDSPEEISAAFASIQEMWSRFGEVPLKDRTGGGVRVTSFTGEELIWNEETHTYTDLAGNILLSGSKYAEKNSPKFDKANILPKTAKAWECNESSLDEIWKFKADISTSWGSAIHSALELYHKYHAIGESIKGKKELSSNYVLPDIPYLKQVVEEFVDKFGVDAMSEVLVSDVSNKMAGTIDRLKITDESNKVCRVGDYKTNADLDSKKKLKYQKQLSFYAHILQNKGWKVEGIDLYYYDPTALEWFVENLEVLPLEG